MRLASPAVNNLRSNASLKAVAAAVRKDESKWWDSHRIWHQAWLDNDHHYSLTELVANKDDTAANASYLRTVADHLDRLSK